MRVRIRNRYADKHSITVHLPADPVELYDMLDRIGADYKTGNVYMNIEDECIPEAMREGGFYDDIFKLNLLAVRIGQLTPAFRAGFTAVLINHEDYNLDDLILVTYGLDTYPIYPCSSYTELGDIVIDNDMIPEVENCPDELIEYLDRELIGRLAAERFTGIFIGGYYCEVGDFILPEMEIKIGKPDRKQFQILAGADERTAQWYSLPCEGDLSHSNIYDMKSPLPNIKNTDDMSELNAVAEKVSILDDDDFVKLKAVMESNHYRSASGALAALNELHRYDFDRNIRSCSEYGREYLRRFLSENFDMNVLNTEYLCDVGNKLLGYKGGELTAYGIISGRGQELYAPVWQEHKQSAAAEKYETESEELGVNFT